MVKQSSQTTNLVGQTNQTQGSFEIELPSQDRPHCCGQAKWWKLLPITVLKVAGIMLIMPTLTNVKTRFFKGDTARAALVQSIVDSSRAASTIMVTVQLGKLSDTVGRRPMLITSVLCTALPLVCLATFPDDLWYYFVTFALAGLLGGQSSPASTAYIADCTPESARARAFGLQGAVISAIVMVLPGVSALIEKHFGQQALSITAVVVEALALCAAFLLPESLPKENRKPFLASIGCRPLVKTVQQLFLRRGSLLWDLAILKFLNGMTRGIPSFFAYRQLLHLTDADFSVLLSVHGLCGILVQAIVLKLFLRQGCSHMTMILFSFVVDFVCSAGKSCFEMFPSKLFLFTLVPIECLSGVFVPSFSALVTKGVDADKGFVLAAFSTVDEITAIISPLVMAAVYQTSPVAPFCLSAFVSLACIAWGWMLRSRIARANTDDAGSSNP